MIVYKVGQLWSAESSHIISAPFRDRRLWTVLQTRVNPFWELAPRSWPWLGLTMSYCTGSYNIVESLLYTYFMVYSRGPPEQWMLYVSILMHLLVWLVLVFRWTPMDLFLLSVPICIRSMLLFSFCLFERLPSKSSYWSCCHLPSRQSGNQCLESNKCTWGVISGRLSQLNLLQIHNTIKCNRI